jgi:hypothetical protein
MNNKKYAIAGLVILSLAVIATAYTLNQVHAQVTDSPFANCVVMSHKDGYTQVVLGTDENCNRELFAKAVSYYKSQGYKEASYSDFLGEQMMTLDK